ncbi:MAG: SAM hydroxide adenosyltransferase, partial [Betaproteobacteria bacterium]
MPIAAEIAAGPFPSDKLESSDKLKVDLDGGALAEIIYIDHYGNAITGLRAANLPKDASLTIGGQRLSFARVYSEVPA